LTSGDASSVANNAGLNGNAGRLRIALLTPYTGANLGDASIQDAMIANLCLRLPDVNSLVSLLTVTTSLNGMVPMPFLSWRISKSAELIREALNSRTKMRALERRISARAVV
jgi:hypothetical protein